jgi:CBS domain containing-hemolysin-like protein
VDGRFPVAELEELLKIDLPVVDTYTIGGVLTNQLRHIPGKDESIDLMGHRFTVIDTDHRRVKKIHIIKL